MAKTHIMAKTMTYGVMHLTVATAVAYGITGDWRVALGIGLIEPAVQTVAYVLHENAWMQHYRRQRLQAHTANTSS